MLTKDISYSVKDVDATKGIVTLYASAFGNKDAGGDIVVKGAFKKTLSENAKRIKHLWQHDKMQPIGVPVEIKEDDFGLLVVSQISSIKNGDFRKMYSEGVITEHSIGYNVVKEEYEAATATTHLKELRLMEYSAVTWGMNEMTPTVDVKAANPEQLAKLQKEANKLASLWKNGTFTDETFKLIGLQIEAIDSQIKALLKAEPSNHSDKTEPPQEIDLVKLYNTI